MVETSYGTFSGKNPLFSVFASTYIDADNLIKGSKFENLNEKNAEKNKAEKSWSLGEMKALLKSLQNIKSLYSNLREVMLVAPGICQFLPSSYLNWGCAKRWQKHVQTYSLLKDAIFSAGNYLKAHGYILNNNEKIKEEFGLYNNSDVYVDTVIELPKK